MSFSGKPKNRTTSIPYWSAPSAAPSRGRRQTRQGGMEPGGRRTRRAPVGKKSCATSSKTISRGRSDRPAWRALARRTVRRRTEITCANPCRKIIKPGWFSNSAAPVCPPPRIGTTSPRWCVPASPPGLRPVIVHSALSGITDRLESLLGAAAAGAHRAALEQIETRHRALANELGVVPRSAVRGVPAGTRTVGAVPGRRAAHFTTGCARG